MSTTPPLPHSPAATLRPVQFVSASVGIGAVMVTAVRVVVDPAAPMPSLAAIAAVLVSLVLSAVLVRAVGYSVPSLPQGLPRENAEATSLRYFTQTTTLRSALCEIPVFVAFGTSFAFEPRSWLPLLIALPGSLALFWLHAWPSARTATAVEQGLEADGAKSWLSEALGLRPAP